VGGGGRERQTEREKFIDNQISTTPLQERERERERSLLRGDTSSITIPPLSVWPGGTTPWRQHTAQSPIRSLEVSGSQTDHLAPWYKGRAEIIPFRYSLFPLGGKGT
jgi:hypothetical protein